MPNPFLTYAGVLERSSHLIHVYLQSDPQLTGYSFYGQMTLNGAYGNPVGSGVGGAGCANLFDVNRGLFFRSPTLRRKGLAALPENRRGTTQAAFDLDDFVTPGGVTPPDDRWLYLRVQENRLGVGGLLLGGVTPLLGGIYLVPPPNAYGQGGPSFSTQGTAPSATGCVAGSPPVFDEDLTSAAPRPMYLVFPTPLAEFTLRNLDGAKTILVSFGAGQQMIPLPAGQDLQLFNGGTKEMVLACPDVGGCAFTLHGVLARMS